MSYDIAQSGINPQYLGQATGLPALPGQSVATTRRTFVAPAALAYNSAGGSNVNAPVFNQSTGTYNPPPATRPPPARTSVVPTRRVVQNTPAPVPITTVASSVRPINTPATPGTAPIAYGLTTAARPTTPSGIVPSTNPVNPNLPTVPVPTPTNVPIRRMVSGTTPVPAPVATPTNFPAPVPTPTNFPAPVATPTNVPVRRMVSGTTPVPAPVATPTNVPAPQPFGTTRVTSPAYTNVPTIPTSTSSPRLASPPPQSTQVTAPVSTMVTPRVGTVPAPLTGVTAVNSPSSSTSRTSITVGSVPASTVSPRSASPQSVTTRSASPQRTTGLTLNNPPNLQYSPILTAPVTSVNIVPVQAPFTAPTAPLPAPRSPSPSSITSRSPSPTLLTPRSPSPQLPQQSSVRLGSTSTATRDIGADVPPRTSTVFPVPAQVLTPRSQSPVLPSSNVLYTPPASSMSAAGPTSEKVDVDPHEVLEELYELLQEQKEQRALSDNYIDVMRVMMPVFAATYNGSQDLTEYLADEDEAYAGLVHEPEYRGAKDYLDSLIDTLQLLRTNKFGPR